MKPVINYVGISLVFGWTLWEKIYSNVHSKPRLLDLDIGFRFFVLEYDNINGNNSFIVVSCCSSSSSCSNSISDNNKNNNNINSNHLVVIITPFAVQM